MLCLSLDSAKKVAVLLQAYARWRQEVAACDQIEQWQELKKGMAPVGPALVRAGLRLARILDTMPHAPTQSPP